MLTRGVRRPLIVDGYYGMSNTGDDAFCYVAAGELNARCPDAPLRFMAQRAPVAAMRTHAALPSRPRLPGQVRAVAAGNLLASRAVLHVGGSTFRRMNRRRRDQMRLARLGRLQLRAVGVSLGPFRSRTDREEIQAFLQLFSSISVRDEASYLRGLRLGLDERLRRGADVALALPDVEPTRRLDGRSVLAVSVCPFESLGEGDADAERTRNDRLVHVLRDVARRIDVRFRFVVFNGHPVHGDESLTRWAASQLTGSAPVDIVPYHRNPCHALAAISSSDGLLGMRLHSAVFAMRAAKPFAVVNYHPKCSDFAAWAGTDPRAVLGATVADPRSASDAVVAMLSGAWQEASRDLAGARRLIEHSFDAAVGPTVGSRRRATS